MLIEQRVKCQGKSIPLIHGGLVDHCAWTSENKINRVEDGRAMI